MHSLLANESAQALRIFLGICFSDSQQSFWNDTVLPSLSFQQRHMVEEKLITSLSGLDLAALLRILDRNWYDISVKSNLGNEARTWIREMQHIRNKWAHAAGHPPTAGDLCPDLDTLQHFLTAIDAEDSLVESIKERKRICLATPPRPETVQFQPETTAPQTEFNLGDLVHLKSDATVNGQGF